MLKRKIKADDFEGAVEEAFRGLYKKRGDSYILDVEPDDDSELRSALELERKDHKKTKSELNSKIADLESLTAGMPTRDELAALRTDAEKAARFEKAAKATALESAATALATKISKSPTVMKPHILARLDVELSDDGDPVVKMRDGKGKLVNFDPEALSKEFVDNADFRDIILANRSSGAGGQRDEGAAGGGSGEGGQARKADFDPLTVDTKTYAARLKAQREAAEQGR